MRLPSQSFLAFLCISALFLTALATETKENKEVKDPNAWQNLLANNSLALWEGTSSSPIGDAWSLNEGVLHLDTNFENLNPQGEQKKGGHLVTKKHYHDFELKFEFLISHGGNSGIKYRTNNKGLGLEYQILDDLNHRDNKKPSHRTAALYDLVEADEEQKKLQPAGKGWNTGRIVANGNLLEHWVNGTLVMTITYGSDAWNPRFKKSKYHKDLSFASQPGSILLQDHQDDVSYRNLYIRELSPTTPQKKALTTLAAPEAFTTNCAACHLLKDVQVGPSLAEIAKLYPAQKQDAFIAWCIDPGKKRPQMPQMPSMVHIPKEDLAKIHTYILKTTHGVTAKRFKPKTDPFAKSPRTTARPRVLRTFLPHTGPASIVIALPTDDKHNLIWDATLCRLRYISKGSVNNWPYLKGNGNSVADPGTILYTETQLYATKSPSTAIQFNGYQLNKDGLPTFRYQIGELQISETIKLEKNQLTRTLTTQATLPHIDLKHTLSPEVETTTTHEEPHQLTITHLLK